MFLAILTISTRNLNLHYGLRWNVYKCDLKRYYSEKIIFFSEQNWIQSHSQRKSNLKKYPFEDTSCKPSFLSRINLESMFLVSEVSCKIKGDKKTLLASLRATLWNTFAVTWNNYLYRFGIVTDIYSYVIKDLTAKSS